VSQLGHGAPDDDDQRVRRRQRGIAVVPIRCPGYLSASWSAGCCAAARPESREPVGSSANRTSGLATRPRASATRCAWPPDSSPDLRPSSPSRASLANNVRACVRAAAPRRTAPRSAAERLNPAASARYRLVFTPGAVISACWSPGWACLHDGNRTGPLLRQGEYGST
jgi:hypothetical protein